MSRAQGSPTGYVGILNLVLLYAGLFGVAWFMMFAFEMQFFDRVVSRDRWIASLVVGGSSIATAALRLRNRLVVVWGIAAGLGYSLLPMGALLFAVAWTAPIPTSGCPVR